MGKKKPVETPETMLRRLLKAEQDEWAGTIGRMSLHQIADEARSFLNKKG